MFRYEFEHEVRDEVIATSAWEAFQAIMERWNAGAYNPRLEDIREGEKIEEEEVEEEEEKGPKRER